MLFFFKKKNLMFAYTLIIENKTTLGKNVTLNDNKKFSLNILKSTQKELAAVFFKPQKALGGRFETAPFTYGELGLPILKDAIGGIECNVVKDTVFWAIPVALSEANLKAVGQDKAKARNGIDT